MSGLNTYRQGLGGQHLLIPSPAGTATTGSVLHPEHMLHKYVVASDEKMFLTWGQPASVESNIYAKNHIFFFFWFLDKNKRYVV